MKMKKKIIARYKLDDIDEFVPGYRVGFQVQLPDTAVGLNIQVAIIAGYPDQVPASNQYPGYPITKIMILSNSSLSKSFFTSFCGFPPYF